MIALGIQENDGEMDSFQERRGTSAITDMEKHPGEMEPSLNAPLSPAVD